MVDAFLYGDSHLHYRDMSPCSICAEENAHWERIIGRFKGDGEAAEDWLQRQEPVKAYNQKYPYDNNAHIASLEEAATSGHLPPDESQPNPEDALIDAEAVNELLADLDPLQQHIMRKSAEGDKPRQIAKDLGHETSGVVRLRKYEARQALGAPTNPKMRRRKK